MRGARVSSGVRFIQTEFGQIFIGARSRIMTQSILAPYKHGSISIGADCTVNPFCILYGHGGLKIGDRVRIAAHTVIIPANHNLGYDEIGSFRDLGLTKKGIVIGSDVWIGSGVRILDGVNICDKVVIGAGSVVTKNITVSGTYVGNPAKFMGTK